MKQAEIDNKALKDAEDEFKQQLESRYECEHKELNERVQAAEAKEAESTEFARKQEEELTSYKVQMTSSPRIE